MANTPSSLRPVRQNTRVVDSAEVMGQGSWIKVRTLTVSENNRFIEMTLASQRLAAQDNPSAEELSKTEHALRSVICGALIAWNWVNDDGEDLPAPHNNPALLDDLTQAEVRFLMDAVRGVEREKKSDKKKTSRS